MEYALCGLSGFLMQLVAVRHFLKLRWTLNLSRPLHPLILSMTSLSFRDVTTLQIPRKPDTELRIGTWFSGLSPALLSSPCPSFLWLVTINLPNISLFPVFPTTSTAAWRTQASTISHLHHLSFSSLLEVFTKWRSDQITFLLGNSQGSFLLFANYLNSLFLK